MTAVERAKERTKPIGFDVIIEATASVMHVAEIAGFSPKLQAISRAAAGFAARMEMQTTGMGGKQKNYGMLEDGARH